MGELKNIITPLHKKTKRDYVARMLDEKPYCMKIAKEYGKDYWDGDRRYGYGGYSFRPGYWKPVAEALIKEYCLTNNSKVLDVGCGKAFLLWEIKQILPGIEIAGFDISLHGINDSRPEIKPFINFGRAEAVPYCKDDNNIYPDKYFDLVISITTLHNLKIFDLEKAVREIARIGKKSYIAVESFRNDEELFNVECWALTCQAFFSPEEWVYLYNKFGGESVDYEFIYFETPKEEINFLKNSMVEFGKEELYEIEKTFDIMAQHTTDAFVRYMEVMNKHLPHSEIQKNIDKHIAEAVKAYDVCRTISAIAQSKRMR